MGKLGLIVIMNIYRRRYEGMFLKRLIEVTARPRGINVEIAYDDGSLGIWKNYRQALTIGTNPGTHRLVIHDDTTFDRQVLEKIIHVIEWLPPESFFPYSILTTKIIKWRRQPGNEY